MNESVDRFLGGRLMVRQPVSGYRSGADPVFLAASVPAKAGERVLELGCGSGVAMLCLATRVAGASVVGVERDVETAALARANMEANRLVAEVVTADLTQLPPGVVATGFHHVMTNPPFFDRAHGSRAVDDVREAGRGEEIPIGAWLDVAIRRLLPGGTLTVIQRAERLPDCLAALDERVGGIRVLPLAPRIGRPAKLTILQAVKGSKAAFRLEPPFVLHRGERHVADENSYTSEAEAILRGGAPFHSFLSAG